MQEEQQHTETDHGIPVKKTGVQFDPEVDNNNRPKFVPLTRTDFDMNIVEKWYEIKAYNPPKRRCNQISFIYKDQLYILGGRDINLGKISDSFVFDLKNLYSHPKWEKLHFTVGNPPEGLANHAGDLVENEYYLFGGENMYNQATNNLYILDIENERWEKKQFSEADIPAMIGHTANYYSAAKSLIVFGGFHKGIYSNSIYTYNNGKWVKIEIHDKAPRGRIFHTATLVGDSLYIYGGETAEGSFLNDLWKYDSTKFVWEEIIVKGEVPKGRSGHSSIYYKGNLYIFGGKVANIQEKNELWKFDLTKSSFTLLHDTLLEQTIDYENAYDAGKKSSRSKIINNM
jgi:hypothetical protein